MSLTGIKSAFPRATSQKYSTSARSTYYAAFACIKDCSAISMSWLQSSLNSNLHGILYTSWIKQWSFAEMWTNDLWCMIWHTCNQGVHWHACDLQAVAQQATQIPAQVIQVTKAPSITHFLCLGLAHGPWFQVLGWTPFHTRNMKILSCQTWGLQRHFAINAFHTYRTAAKKYPLRRFCTHKGLFCNLFVMGTKGDWIRLAW